MYPWFYYIVPESVQVSLVCLTLLPRQRTPPPKVELNEGGYRNGGSAPSSSDASAHALEVQGSATKSQPLLEGWARGGESLHSISLNSIPALSEEK